MSRSFAKISRSRGPASSARSQPRRRSSARTEVTWSGAHRARASVTAASCRCGAQVALKYTTPRSVEELANDEQRPLVPDDFKGARNVVSMLFHQFLTIVGVACYLQLSRLGFRAKEVKSQWRSQPYRTRAHS